MSKIDRVLRNDQWEESFPTSMDQFLTLEEYDHTPILVSSPSQYSKNPFRFFNCWAQKAGFHNIIRDHWCTDIKGCVSYQITKRLRLLKSKMKLLFGKEHSRIEVDKANVELLHLQNLLHDNPGDQTLAT